MRSATILAAAFFLAIPASLAATTEGTGTDAGTRVTYLAGSSVYLDAGSEDGIRVGQKLDVVRDDALVAVVEVAEASSHRARCATLGEAGAVRVGDAVRTAGSDPPGNGAGVAAQGKESSPPGPSRRSGGIHGRIGARYLDVRRTDGVKGGYHQPALDLRIDGRQVGGAPLTLAVDVRARRTYRTFSNAGSDTESRNRVYRLAAVWEGAGQPWRIGFGRQYSPSLAVVSLFDGVFGEYRTERWAAGGFGGTEPDPETYAFSREVHDFGGFYEYGNAAGAARRWAITTGVVGSYQEKEINREFVFLQGRFDDRRLSAYLAQEIDVNRGWRRQAEGDSWTLTSTFASLRYRFAEAFAIRAGYDDRRNARLFRDRITPETEFDDTYRQGSWAGFDGRAGRHVLYGIDGRRSGGGPAGTADAYTGTIGVAQLTRAALGFRLRSTRYTNETTEGWLHSASLSGDLGSWSRLEVQGGRRTESVHLSAVPTGSLSWFGVDWEAVLARRWLLTLSAERNQGASEGSDQLYVTVSWRF